MENQIDKNEKIRISIFLKILDNQRMYCTFDIELLVICLTGFHLKHQLGGRHITILSGHSSSSFQENNPHKIR